MHGNDKMQKSGNLISRFDLKKYPMMGISESEPTNKTINKKNPAEAGHVTLFSFRERDEEDKERTKKPFYGISQHCIQTIALPGSLTFSFL